MHERTGAIAQFETEEDAKEAGYRIPLNEKEVALLGHLNRHERRKWLSQERQESKARLLEKKRRARK